MIYILELEKEKISIERTAKRIDEDVIQYFSKNLSDWTSKYKPIKILEMIETIDLLDDDKYTKIYMLEYGIENVRGGSYSRIELFDFQIKSLNLEFCKILDVCFCCGEKGHCLHECSQYKKCDICNKYGHDNEHCYTNLYLGKKILTSVILKTTISKLLEEKKSARINDEKKIHGNRNNEANAINELIATFKMSLKRDLEINKDWVANGFNMFDSHVLQNIRSDGSPHLTSFEKAMIEMIDTAPETVQNIILKYCKIILLDFSELNDKHTYILQDSSINVIKMCFIKLMIITSSFDLKEKQPCEKNIGRTEKYNSLAESIKETFYEIYHKMKCDLEKRTKCDNDIILLFRKKNEELLQTFLLL